MMSAKNDNTSNIIRITKDLNLPNYSAQLSLPKQMTHPISDSSNNISLGTNAIDVNGNIFGLLSDIKNFLALSTPKTLMLTKIKILHYPMRM